MTTTRVFAPACHPRRQYLLIALTARQRGEDAIWYVARGQQQAIAGTALPASLPGRDLLVAAGYECTEDVDGARADELTKAAGLSRRDAEAALAALGS